MKRLFLIILSFIFLGGAVSSSAFYINSSLYTVEHETNGGGKFTTSENENLDNTKANAPTNDGYWTDAGNYATSFAGGTGTEDDPYLISTPQQLAYLSYLVNNSSTNSQYASLYYEQTADIDLSAYYWSGIGLFIDYNEYYVFSGDYNGNDYIISGLYIYSEQDGGIVEESGYGLFSLVEGNSSAHPSKIHNIKLVSGNLIVLGYYQNCGGIVGAGRYVHIFNCTNRIDIINTQACAGGIVGSVWYGEIYNCFNSGNISTRDSYGGGIVGMLSGNLSNCYNVGSVTSSERAGGIVGQVSDCLITNCYNTGTIRQSFSGTYSSVGGIAGTGGSINGIFNCFNLGILGTSNYTGGIIGRGSSAGSSYIDSDYLQYCYVADYYTYGVIGDRGSYMHCEQCTIENAKDISWYTNSSNWYADHPWDFENTWSFIEGMNDGYPVLTELSIVTISFDVNGGAGNMASVEVEPNASVTLPKCTFTRTGYEFSGWALSPTGVVMYSDGQTITPTASMTLYAIWRVGVYEITLNWNGGSGTWDKIYYKTGAGYFDSENCTILVSAGALIVRAERAGYSFSSFTTNANGTGTIMFQNETYMNSSTIVADDVWYAQWTVNNEAKYDSAGGYWYIENGKIPQTKVTNSTLITNLNKATTNGANYYIAGQTLTAKLYNGTEYCKWNNNWYEVEPIRWRLTKDSNQSNGYGTETDTNAVLDKIVFVGQFSTTALGSGKGYSEDSVEEFMKNDIDTTYMIRTTKFVDTFGTGASLYGNQQFRTNFMFVSSQSEIEAVNGDLTITFSDLVKDMIKYYGGTNSYFTRDLGSNYNNITCINAVGKETQCFATNFRGVQFTICFTEYACVS